MATGPLDPTFEYGNKADVSEIEKSKKKFRPNPKRQLILVVLALIGLVVGYGLGFVFKRPEPAPIPAPVQPARECLAGNGFVSRSQTRLSLMLGTLPGAWNQPMNG